MARPSPLFALAALALIPGCAGPPIPAPIEDEVVCPDFESGHASMEGGLKFPVRLRVMDGKRPVFRIVLTGRRHAGDPAPRSYIADDNEKYTVEWAQCANERAPRVALPAGHTKKAHEAPPIPDSTDYECGEATVYKTVPLVTKKGDRASHNLAFAPPPNATCWTSPSAAAKRDGEVADAGAPDAGDGALDAGAPDAAQGLVDAGTASNTGLVADGGARDGGVPKPAASAKKP